MSRPNGTRERILETAAEMFATRGFSGTGVDDIGEAIGLTGPALYRHFANKQALLDEICLSGQRALLEDALQIVRENRPPKETLISLVKMRIRFAYGPHRHVFVIRNATDTRLSDEAQVGVQAVGDLYRAEWMRILTQVRPSARTDELQVAWLAAQMLISYTAIASHTRSVDEHQRHLERMALAVLLA